MTAAVSFDTLAFAKKLEAVGFEPRQAEGLTDAFRGAIASSELADKNDVDELKAEIAEVKSELKAEIAEVRSEIANVKSELKGDIAALDNKIDLVEAVLKGEINAVKVELGYMKWLMGIVLAGVITLVIKSFI